MTTPAADPTEAPTEPGRGFWQGVLAAGAGTTIPRWTLDPVPGVGEHQAPIPKETVVAARQLAYHLGVPLRTVLLAAHAEVLAALSGERDVVVGYLADPVVRPLPCRLSTEAASWRAMVEKTHRTESALRAYAGFPVDDLRRELGVTGPSFETVFRSTGVGDLSENVVLEVGFPEQNGRCALRLRYRTEVLDAGSAAHIAGYHLTALARIVASPDAEHHRQSLLSAEELRFQLHALARPARERPDRRVAGGAGRHGRRGAPDRARHDRQQCSMTATAATTGPAVAPDGSGPAVPTFAVISGELVRGALEGRETEIVELVEDTYRLHGAGDTVNPPSYFLRFPDRPSSRIIALPASLGGQVRVDGLKWISSFPDNVAAGIPRASAVLILNDRETGYPFAVMESSIISATRTAASAALAADWLSRSRPRPNRLGFLGSGLIARYIHTFLIGTGWRFDRIGVHDLSADSAAGFCGYLQQSATGGIAMYDSAEQLIRASDLIVFATTAACPHVHDVSSFDHHPLVLHISLRDLAPEILLAASNIVDDVEHCLKAETSPHLAERLTGGRNFLNGTLDDVLNARVAVPADRSVIFSPFGLGVLDLAVGKYVYDRVASSGRLQVVDGFFHELRRHG